MKKILIPAFTFLIAVLSGTAKNPGGQRTLVADNGLGALRMRVYNRVSADSIPGVLVLYGYEHSGDAVFTLSEPDTAGNLKYLQGRVYTLRGENDATLWQCVSPDRQMIYFLVTTEADTVYRVPDEASRTHDIPYRILK